MPALIQEVSDSELGSPAGTLSRACTDCVTGTKFPIHRAASLGHVKCLRHILSKNEAPEMLLDPEYNTPMHAAAASGQAEVLSYLTDNTRIPVRLPNSRGLTCAHLAAERGRLDALKVLLGGPLWRAQSLAYERDRRGCTVLHSAVLHSDNDIAAWLLQRFGKAIANIPDKDNVLPLHISCAQGNLEFIQVATKFDVLMVAKRDFNGATPAFYAAQAGHLQCLKYLIDKCKADIQTITTRGYTLLHAACLNGHMMVAQWLVSRMDKSTLFLPTEDGVMVYHCAAFNGHFSILRLLLKASSNSKKYMLTSADKGGNTPLHLAAMNDHIYSSKLLLDLGADPKMKNKKGETPYDIARQKGHSQIIELLTSYLNNGSVTKKYKRKSRSLSLFPFLRSAPPPTRSVSSGYTTTKSEGPYGRITLPIMGNNHRYPAESVKTPSSGYASSNENVNHAFIPPNDSGSTLAAWLNRVDGDDELVLSRENWLMKRRSDPFPNSMIRPSSESPRRVGQLNSSDRRPLSHTANSPAPERPKRTDKRNFKKTEVSPAPIPRVRDHPRTTKSMSQNENIYAKTERKQEHRRQPSEKITKDRSGKRTEPNRSKDDNVIKRTFVDVEMQTEPDPLQRDIIIVDDKERIVFSSTIDIPGIYAKIKRQSAISKLHGNGGDSTDDDGTDAELDGRPVKLRIRGRRKHRHSKNTSMPVSNPKGKRESQLPFPLEAPSARGRRFLSFPGEGSAIYAAIYSVQEVQQMEGLEHSNETRPQMVLDSDREVKYAGIRAAEQIDRILDQEEGIPEEPSGHQLAHTNTSRDHTTVTAVATVHHVGVGIEADDPKAEEKPLIVKGSKAIPKQKSPRIPQRHRRTPRPTIRSQHHAETAQLRPLCYFPAPGTTVHLLEYVDVTTMVDNLTTDAEVARAMASCSPLIDQRAPVADSRRSRDGIIRPIPRRPLPVVPTQPKAEARLSISTSVNSTPSRTHFTTDLKPASPQAVSDRFSCRSVSLSDVSTIDASQSSTIERQRRLSINEMIPESIEIPEKTQSESIVLVNGRFVIESDDHYHSIHVGEVNRSSSRRKKADHSESRRHQAKISTSSSGTSLMESSSFHIPVEDRRLCGKKVSQLRMQFEETDGMQKYGTMADSDDVLFRHNKEDRRCLLQHKDRSQTMAAVDGLRFFGTTRASNPDIWCCMPTDAADDDDRNNWRSLRSDNYGKSHTSPVIHRANQRTIIEEPEESDTSGDHDTTIEAAQPAYRRVNVYDV